MIVTRTEIDRGRRRRIGARTLEQALRHHRHLRAELAREVATVRGGGDGLTRQRGRGRRRQRRFVGDVIVHLEPPLQGPLGAGPVTDDEIVIELVEPQIVARRLAPVEQCGERHRICPLVLPPGRRRERRRRRRLGIADDQRRLARRRSELRGRAGAPGLRRCDVGRRDRSRVMTARLDRHRRQRRRLVTAGRLDERVRDGLPARTHPGALLRRGGIIVDVRRRRRGLAAAPCEGDGLVGARHGEP